MTRSRVLQDVACEVAVAEQFAQVRLDHLRRDRDRFTGPLGASKLSSLSSRSSTVCSRRAPMFSAVELISAAIVAMVFTASSVKSRVTFSVAQQLGVLTDE